MSLNIGVRIEIRSRYEADDGDARKELYRKTANGSVIKGEHAKCKAC